MRKFLFFGFLFTTFLSLQLIAKTGLNRSKWADSVLPNVTRCFLVKDTRVSCDTYWTEGKKYSSLEIKSEDFNGKKFSYGYNKMFEGSLCDEHVLRIRPLLKGTEQVCITGHGESELEDSTSIARWVDLETKKGRTEWNDAFSGK